jgi:hypothetical protein
LIFFGKLLLKELGEHGVRLYLSLQPPGDGTLGTTNSFCDLFLGAHVFLGVANLNFGGLR